MKKHRRPCNVDAAFQHLLIPRVLHRAAREWLQCETIDGMTHAELYADRDGRLQPLR